MLHAMALASPILYACAVRCTNWDLICSLLPPTNEIPTNGKYCTCVLTVFFPRIYNSVDNGFFMKPEDRLKNPANPINWGLFEISAADALPTGGC